MKEKERYEILYEAMNGKIDGIAEGVGNLVDQMSRLKDVPERLERIERKIDGVIEPVVKDHSVRIAALETKVFGS